MEQDEIRQPRNWSTRLMILAIAFVLYVASSGPALWLSRRIDPRHEGVAGKATAMIYGPLVMASGLVGPKTALLRYFELFVDVRR